MARECLHKLISKDRGVQVAFLLPESPFNGSAYTTPSVSLFYPPVENTPVSLHFSHDVFIIISHLCHGSNNSHGQRTGQ